MRCNLISYMEWEYFALNIALKCVLYRARSARVNFICLNFGQCVQGEYSQVFFLYRLNPAGGGGGGGGGGKSATILKTTAKSERRQVQQSGPAAEAVQKELFRGLHQSARS